jgi:hypothetical protein
VLRRLSLTVLCEALKQINERLRSVQVILLGVPFVKIQRFVDFPIVLSQHDRWLRGLRFFGLRIHRGDFLRHKRLTGIDCHRFVARDFGRFLCVLAATTIAKTATEREFINEYLDRMLSQDSDPEAMRLVQ